MSVDVLRGYRAACASVHGTLNRFMVWVRLSTLCLVVCMACGVAAFDSRFARAWFATYTVFVLARLILLVAEYVFRWKIDRREHQE